MACWPLTVVAFQVACGLPLLLLSATMAVVEERGRGSLHILLVTPVATRSIVLAKWWGAFRELPRVLVLPLLVAGVDAWINDTWPLLGLARCFHLRLMPRSGPVSVCALDVDRASWDALPPWRWLPTPWSASAGPCWSARSSTHRCEWAWRLSAPSTGRFPWFSVAGFQDSSITHSFGFRAGLPEKRWSPPGCCSRRWRHLTAAWDA